MPWQKGQSGNPGGRVKGAIDLPKLARSHTEAAVNALVRALKDHRTCVPAAVALLDRGYGKPAQTIQGDAEKPVAIEFSWGAVQPGPGELQSRTIDHHGNRLELVWVQPTDDESNTA